MENITLDQVIHYLRQHNDLNEDTPQFIIHPEETDEAEWTFNLSGNRKGLQSMALDLLVAASKTKEEVHLHPSQDNSTAYFAPGTRLPNLYYVQNTELETPRPVPLPAPASFREKLGNFAGCSILILLIAALLTGLYTIGSWIV